MRSLTENLFLMHRPTLVARVTKLSLEALYIPPGSRKNVNASTPSSSTTTKYALLCVCLIVIINVSSHAQVVPPHSHVVVVAFENHSYEAKWGGVINDTTSAGMPYLNGTLVPTYGLTKNFYANGHDSLKQYFELTAGTEYCFPFGSGSGSVSCGDDPQNYDATAENIFHTVQQAGQSWKQYAECMPNSTYGVARGNIKETSPVPGCGIAGNYVPRHIPAIYYAAVRQGTSPGSDVDCSGVPNKGYVNALSLQGCNVVQFENPIWGFAADIAAKRLPNFSFITPSAQNDGHDGSRAAADAWMRKNLQPLLSSCYFTGVGCAPDGLLIIWWDEGATGDSAYMGPCGNAGTDGRSNSLGTCNGGGRVAIVIAGKDVKRGYKAGTYYQHPAITKAILEALDLPANGFPSAVRSANSMAGFFKNLVSNIDDMSFTCDSTCSGNSTLDTSPGKQMDGQSLKLSFTGGGAYNSAMFDASPPISNDQTKDFDLDFWAQVSSFGAPQALEFSMVQILKGREYPFQHQCDFKATKKWRVWSPGNGGSWVNTGVGCSAFMGTWNHFTLHFSRNARNQLVYKDIVINGVLYKWNSGLVFNPISNSNPNSLTFRIRLAGDSIPTTYTVWVDKMNLN